MPPKRKPLSQRSVNGNVTKRTKCDTDENVVEESTVQKRAGTIKKMVLCNFMCHSLMEVEFSDGITFITGRNGSGKSAILTALVVGLGGKASLTNRGNSIKGFIKKGKSMGSVEITIRNTGECGYKPNVYGRYIIVQRSFTATSSTYKIKSENGQVISKQAREVRNITSYLGIQVDNPICILNQDTSRNFLSTSNPHHKFTLFMRASRLEQLAEQYDILFRNRDTAIRLLAEEKAALKMQEQELKVLEERVRDLKSMESMKDQLRQLHVELVWAEVRDAEAEVQEKERVVQKKEEKYKELCDSCDSTSGQFGVIQEKIRSLQQQIIEIKDAIEVKRAPEHDTKRALTELRQNFEEVARKQRVLEKSIRTCVENAESIEEEIRHATENMNRAEQEKLEKIRKLKKIEEKLSEIENVLETTRNDLFQMKSDVSRKEDIERHLRAEISEVDQKIASDRASLEALNRESNNVLLLYGRDYPRILQEIHNRRREFKQLPKGPLGQYISLKDRKWAIAVESFLGKGLLGAFLCDNVQDTTVLKDILKRHWRDGNQPMLITSKFFTQLHRIEPNKVQPINGCISMFDALNISDPVVANSIIDQKNIESILLIPTEQQAIHLMSERARVPRNCSQGITVTGNVYYPDPNYRTYACKYRQARYLQVDPKERIQQLENSLEQQARQREAVDERYRNACIERKEQAAKIHTLEQKIRTLHSTKERLRNERDGLKLIDNQEVASAEALEEELAEIQSAKVRKTAELDELKNESKEIERRIKETQEELSKHVRARESLEERIEPLEGQIMDQTTQLKEMRANQQFGKERMEQAKNKLNLAKSDLLKKQEFLHGKIQAGHGVGERLEVLRHVPIILAEMKRLKNTIAKINDSIENPIELQQKHDEKLQHCIRTAELIANLSLDSKELTTAVDKRKRAYMLTEEFYVSFAKNSFESVLNYRQFQGTMDIDLIAKKLELIVIPQQGSQGHTTTANLSGGERSFSTVAFLYALWNCINFPLHFLDEFDVYMDKLNRTKVMEVLLHYARDHPDLQFVFLTPQDVSFLVDKEGVVIHKLEDPERRQK